MWSYTPSVREDDDEATRIEWPEINRTTEEVLSPNTASASLPYKDPCGDINKDLAVMEALKNTVRRIETVRRFMHGMPIQHYEWYGKIIADAKQFLYYEIKEKLLAHEFMDNKFF